MIDIVYRIYTGNKTNSGKRIYSGFIRGQVPKLQETMELPTGTVLKFTDKGRLWEEYHVWKNNMGASNVTLSHIAPATSEKEAIANYRRSIGRAVMEDQLVRAKLRRAKNNKSKKKRRSKRR